MNRLSGLLPCARLDIGRVRRIRAGLPAPTNHPNEAEVFAVSSRPGVPSIGAKRAWSKTTLGSFLFCVTFALCPAVAADLKTVFLGSAAPFAVLGGTKVTNTGTTPHTVVTGDLGLYPAPGTRVTGFRRENGGGPGVVIGAIDDNDTPGETTAARHAQASLTIAINDAAGRTGAFTPVTELAGMTLSPGLYRADAILSISGTCYLRGNGVFIFQIKTGLTVTDSTQVILEGGAQAANVFWQVGTQATLGTNAKLEGNILAGTAITMKAGTTLVGRALAKAEVTFISDTVTRP